MAAHGIDLVDEDDAGRVLLGLLEHVAHAAGADADEHLHEVRAGNVEKRHARLAGDGAAEQGLAGAGRADHQRALGNLAAQALELGRVLQEVDDLGQILLGLVDAGDVIESHPVLVLGEQAGLRLAETHRATGAALHLPHQENPGADDQHDRDRIDQDLHQQRRARRQEGDLAALGVHLLGQLIVVLAGGDDVPSALLAVVHLDIATVDGHIGDVALIDFAQELGVRHLLGRRRPLPLTLHHAGDHQHGDDDDAPNGQVAQIHSMGLVTPKATNLGAR